MKSIVTLIFATTLLALSFSSYAKPLKGFNEGPYLYLEAGVMQADFEYNQLSDIKIGHDFEPAFGLVFGWNIWDWFSAELQGRYGTNMTSGKREHLVGADIDGKYFFILDDLTDFPTLRIMPTVKGGFAFRVAALPGDPNTTDSVVTTFGWGPMFGGGISFLLKRYISFGVEVQEDLLFFEDTRQDLTVNGVAQPNTVIYKGGFKPQFTAMGFIGVHY